MFLSWNAFLTSWLLSCTRIGKSYFFKQKSWLSFARVRPWIWKEWCVHTKMASYKYLGLKANIFDWRQLCYPSGWHSQISPICSVRIWSESAHHMYDLWLIDFFKKIQLLVLYHFKLLLTALSPAYKECMVNKSNQGNKQTKMQTSC